MTSVGIALRIGLVVGVGAGAWFFYQRAGGSDQRQKVLEARIAALEANGPGQPERVIERQIRVEVQPPAAALPGSMASAEPEGSEAAPASGRTFNSNAELAAAYATDFHNEPVDRAWADEAGETYLPAIKNALPASSQLVSFECRTQFCDVAVVHQSIDTSNKFILDLFAMDRKGPLAQSGGFRAGVPTQTEDGKLLYHLYVGRRGAVLAIDPPAVKPVPHAEKL